MQTFMKQPPLAEQFTPVELRQHIEARTEPDLVGGCWLWAGAISPGGYGVMCFGRRWHQRSVRAHRLAYEAWRGPIPPELVIDHKCRVRSCVNPEHLRAVTKRTNTLSNSLSPTAINAAKTHCVRGHPLPKAMGDRGRECQPCAAAASQRSTLRRRAAGRSLQ